MEPAKWTRNGHFRRAGEPRYHCDLFRYRHVCAASECHGHAAFLVQRNESDGESTAAPRYRYYSELRGPRAVAHGNDYRAVHTFWLRHNASELRGGCFRGRGLVRRL